MLADNVEPGVHSLEAKLPVSAAAGMSHELAEHAELAAPVSEALRLPAPALQEFPGLVLSACVVERVQLRNQLWHADLLRAGLGVWQAGILAAVKAAAGFQIVHA